MRLVTLEKSDPVFNDIAAMINAAGYESALRINIEGGDFGPVLSGLFAGTKEDLPVYIMDSDLYLDQNIHILLGMHRAAYRNRATVLLVAPEDALNNLECFPFGIHEIIFKPLLKADLLARIQAALQWGRENDRLQKIERELINLTTKSKEDYRPDITSGFAGRDFFEAYFELEWKRSEEEKNLLCVMAVKPDLIPESNPGHTPDIIKSISEFLLENLRRPGDFLANYHDDVFIALVSVQDFEGAKIVSDKMRSSVAGRILNVSGISYMLSVSIGASVVNPSAGASRSDALLFAVEAMNQSSRNGGNQVTFTDIDAL